MMPSSGRLRSVLAHLQHQRCSGEALQPRGSDDGGAAEQVLSAATLDLHDAIARLDRFGFCVIAGVLDAEELAAACEALGMPFSSEEELRRVVTAADGDASTDTVVAPRSLMEPVLSCPLEGGVWN